MQSLNWQAKAQIGRSLCCYSQYKTRCSFYVIPSTRFISSSLKTFYHGELFQFESLLILSAGHQNHYNYCLGCSTLPEYLLTEKKKELSFSFSWKCNKSGVLIFPMLSNLIFLRIHEELYLKCGQFTNTQLVNTIGVRLVPVKNRKLKIQVFYPN